MGRFGTLCLMVVIAVVYLLLVVLRNTWFDANEKEKEMRVVCRQPAAVSTPTY